MPWLRGPDEMDHRDAPGYICSAKREAGGLGLGQMLEKHVQSLRQVQLFARRPVGHKIIDDILVAHVPTIGSIAAEGHSQLDQQPLQRFFIRLNHHQPRVEPHPVRIDEMAALARREIRPVEEKVDIRHYQHVGVKKHELVKLPPDYPKEAVCRTCISNARMPHCSEFPVLQRHIPQALRLLFHACEAVPQSSRPNPLSRHTQKESPYPLPSASGPTPTLPANNSLN